MKRMMHKNMQMIIGYLLLIVVSWSYSPIQLFITNLDLFTNKTTLHQQQHSSQSLNHKNHTTDKLTLKGCLNDYENNEAKEYNDKKTDLKHLGTVFTSLNSDHSLSLSFISVKIKTALTKSFLKFFSNPYLYIRHSTYRL